MMSARLTATCEVALALRKTDRELWALAIATANKLQTVAVKSYEKIPNSIHPHVRY